MKLIPLTQGQFAMVDDEDYEWINKFSWKSDKTPKTFYASTNLPATETRKRTSIQMQRLILNISNPKLFADHIDHNGLNNQRNNLRIATRSQNNANRISLPNSKSKYLGVMVHLPSEKTRRKNIGYESQISVNGRKITKMFKTEIEAALFYNELAKLHHGEFANLNIISSPDLAREFY